MGLDGGGKGWIFVNKTIIKYLQCFNGQVMVVMMDELFVSSACYLFPHCFHAYFGSAVLQFSKSVQNIQTKIC